mgnify:FL=1
MRRDRGAMNINFFSPNLFVRESGGSVDNSMNVLDKGFECDI